VTSDDGSLFLVGDKKQAIYGWRGGDVRLFDEIFTRYAGNMHKDTMAESWRSCPQVLALVNRICGNTSAMRSLFGLAADRWQWEPHISALQTARPRKIRRSARRSRRRLGRSASNAPSKSSNNSASARKQMTCGILLRDNKKARDMADFLRSHRFDVVLDGNRSPATDSPVGWLVSSNTPLARQPGTMPLPAKSWQCLRSAAPNTPQHGRSWDALWLDLSERIARLRFRPSACAAGSPPIPPVHGRTSASAVRRTCYTRLLREMDNQGIVSAREAAEWLERVEVAQSPGSAQVQVMTIHKSKGPRFRCRHPARNLQRHHSRSPTIRCGPWRWLDPRNSSPQWVRAIIPELRQAEDAWSRTQRYEAFCMLYVALTRAKRGLYVLLDPPPEKSDPDKPTLANWLRHTLDEENDGILFQSGSPDWIPGLRPLPAEPTHHHHSGLTLGTAIARRARVSPSFLKPAHTPPPTSPSAGRSYGSEFHSLMRHVYWIDQDLPTLPHSPAADAVRALLAEPSLAPLFLRNHRTIDLLIEQPVDAFLQGAYLSGVIDRLHLHRDPGGNIVHIDIIDWKTDAVASPSDLTDRYSAQMNAYRDALRALHPHAGIACHLVSVPHRRMVPTC
jgi:ATP-dependent helicase/nuclease subunit A